MGHGHSHGVGTGQGHAPDRAANKTALKVTVGMTATFTVVEVIGGLVTGSLALLADAGHMLSDSLSLGLALFAIWLAERPPTPRKSFGYQRAEILAALANGLTLVAISGWIFYEAYGRIQDPPEILGGPMLVVAVLGLAVNGIAFYILSRSQGESLNVTAALRHVLADLAGSVGVIVASVVILTTGWREADPLIGALIGALVLTSSWSIIRDSVRILLEQAPAGLDPEEIGEAMATAPGVVEVHDLHVWTVTSGFPALAAHVLVGPDEDCHQRRRELDELIADRFEISHTTLQVDHARPESELLQIEGAGENEGRAGADDGPTRTEQIPSDGPQAFLFADIAGFTALTETHGDERAVAVVDDFARHAERLLERHGGELVKSIGDALMLRAADPAAAIRIGLDLAHHEMSRPDHPEVRIGIDYGKATRQGSDWLGATVNTAARIAGLARGGEVLVSDSARRAAERKLSGVSFAGRGPQRLRNIRGPVAVSEARCEDEAAALVIDPVCRIALDPDQDLPRESHRGFQYTFCSERCRSTFLGDPEAVLDAAGRE